MVDPGLPEQLSPNQYPPTSKPTKDSVFRIAYSGQLNRPIKADKQPGLCEKRFRIFAFGVILISILICVFDVSLKPISYKGLFINRPYYGLHSWANANRAWAAGNHVKYAPGLYQGLPYPKLRGIRAPVRTYKPEI